MHVQTDRESESQLTDYARKSSGVKFAIQSSCAKVVNEDAVQSLGFVDRKRRGIGMSGCTFHGMIACKTACHNLEVVLIRFSKP